MMFEDYSLLHDSRVTRSTCAVISLAIANYFASAITSTVTAMWAAAGALNTDIKNLDEAYHNATLASNSTAILTEMYRDAASNWLMNFLINAAWIPYAFIMYAVLWRAAYQGEGRKRFAAVTVFGGTAAIVSAIMAYLPFSETKGLAIFFALSAFLPMLVTRSKGSDDLFELLKRLFNGEEIAERQLVTALKSIHIEVPEQNRVMIQMTDDNESVDQSLADFVNRYLTELNRQATMVPDIINDFNSTIDVTRSKIVITNHSKSILIEVNTNQRHLWNLYQYGTFAVGVPSALFATTTYPAFATVVTSLIKLPAGYVLAPVITSSSLFFFAVSFFYLLKRVLQLYKDDLPERFRRLKQDFQNKQWLKVIWDIVQIILILPSPIIAYWSAQSVRDLVKTAIDAKPPRFNFYSLFGPQFKPGTDGAAWLITFGLASGLMINLKTAADFFNDNKAKGELTTDKVAEAIDNDQAHPFTTKPELRDLFNQANKSVAEMITAARRANQLAGDQVYTLEYVPGNEEMTF